MEGGGSTCFYFVWYHRFYPLADPSYRPLSPPIKFFFSFWAQNNVRHSRLPKGKPFSKKKLKDLNSLVCWFLASGMRGRNRRRRGIYCSATVVKGNDINLKILFYMYIWVSYVSIPPRTGKLMFILYCGGTLKILCRIERIFFPKFFTYVSGMIGEVST